jgi:hypothetical protein
VFLLGLNESFYQNKSKYINYSDWLGAGRPKDRSLNPCLVNNIFFSMSAFTGSEVHPTSYSMDMWAPLSWGKAAGA